MRKDFEMAVARQCAPLLFDKKPAALLASRCLPQQCAWELARARGLYCTRFVRQGKSPLVFVYRPALLEDALGHAKVLRALRDMGYPVEKGWRALLAHLGRRFRDGADFPHEVGFFLGYPPEDVLGFINQDSECKLRGGAWRVYADDGRAATLFREYALCKQLLLAHIESGGSIFSGNLPALAG